MWKLDESIGMFINSIFTLHCNTLFSVKGANRTDIDIDPKQICSFIREFFFIHVLTAIKWACGCGEKQFIKSLVTKLSPSKDWRYLWVFLTRIGDMKIEVYISKIVLYENQNGNFLKSNDENLRSFSMLRPEYSVIAQSWHSTLT